MHSSAAALAASSYYYIIIGHFSQYFYSTLEGQGKYPIR
jgi:hypothetical protein